MEDTNYWNCSASKGEGEEYYIEGLNIWDYKWKDTGEYFLKKDAVRQLNYKIVIFEITNEDKIVRFGAAEGSVSAWVIYTNYYQPVN
jgi:hypothetical protein